MKVLEKKKATLIALGVLVAVVGYFNWTNPIKVEDTMPTTAEYEKMEEENLGETTLVNAPAENDYFAQARMDRDAGRSKSIETLNTLIANEESSEESRQNAEKEVSAIAKQSDAEVTVENLIKAKGYEDAVVYISEESINVVVKCEELKPEDISLIQEIVTEYTGAGAEKIKIVEIN